MIKPVIIEELFKVNTNLSPFFVDDVIVIDNYYKNLKEIQNVLNDSYAPQWKRHKDSRNFIDYYDCRPVLPNQTVSSEYLQDMNYLADLIQKYYKEPNTLRLKWSNYEFNFFKNIKVPNSKFQHMPHRDSDYAGIIYLDNISSGGTAFYDNKLNIENTEDINVFLDTSNLQKNIIKAKPNRLILFKGTNLHGGYIEEHEKYVSDWRINQVIFFHKNKDAPNSNKKPY